MRVLINGFGRIGRTLLRQILTDSRNSDIEVVGINDIASLETCAYLFCYDSVFGPFPGTVEEAPDALVVDGRAIPFTMLADLSLADLSGVDLVLESTGKAKSREVAERGLKAGAAGVLISGPSDAADITAVFGANADSIGDAKIVSNASCTTNAIAPLLRPLHEALGIARAHITTVHCYTGSQPTVDAPAASLERSRAAAVSMVPTSTSAATQVARVLPAMADKLTVSAVRVPCISVSAIDAVIQLERAPDRPLDHLLRETFAGSTLVGLTDDPCVSTDMRARPESLVLAMPETRQVGDRQVRLFGWYDNEWGFSARMIDMARRMAARA
ncbi:MAG: aldehyde dehydrogenase [Rhizobiales bacterium]|nr:aldehyde dehydrogenase [Hyphomicrobiales bacterium]MBO6700625.1 aldehyde dehydrogenase [Hyphomicrobiales bacterium]MBO6738161.1 aldehyde dehydrogenase [Hyphomicrobiales bacterium]MBO6913532.1 aldehyde dehydrogenase [Hyphomicrobiales bacterium]MBO6955299.1 aldehyde dehydrogenase [Hyphomicrobiales bacterium]